jgi:hypothetical protein
MLYRKSYTSILDSRCSPVPFLSLSSSQSVLSSKFEVQVVEVQCSGWVPCFMEREKLKLIFVSLASLSLLKMHLNGVACVRLHSSATVSMSTFHA